MFNRPYPGQAKLMSTISGKKTVVQMDSKIERVGDNLFEITKSKPLEKLRLNFDGSKTYTRDGWEEVC